MQMNCTVTKAHKAVFLWGWGLNGSLDNSFHSWLGSARVGCDVGLTGMNEMNCTVTKAHKAVFLWGWGLNGSLDNSFHSWLGSARVGCDVGLVTSLAWNGMNANELYGHQSPQGGISLGMGLKRFP